MAHLLSYFFENNILSILLFKSQNYFTIATQSIWVWHLGINVFTVRRNQSEMISPLYYVAEFIQRSYGLRVFVCPSVCPSVRGITFERVGIFKFWFHQSVGMVKRQIEFGNGHIWITGSGWYVKGQCFFKWQHRSNGISFDRDFHADFKHAFCVILR